MENVLLELGFSEYAPEMYVLGDLYAFTSPHGWELQLDTELRQYYAASMEITLYEGRSEEVFRALVEYHRR
ncbi:MAG: hypothetical protein LC650_03835 [Actinobacteria bacterium]|nr:hypothetical protein [Actinomycetota bacterium]